jgi:hypothetical protein
MAKRPDPAPLKRHVDPITRKVLTPEKPYPAGQGKIRKSGEGSIRDAVDAESARGKPSRK